MSVGRIALIATDLDGTLLGEGGVTLAENAGALRRAEREGIRIAIASGRLPGVCSRIAVEMGLSACYIIALNGAQIWEAPFGREIVTCGLPEDTAHACWRVLEGAACPTTLYTASEVWTNQRFETAAALARYESYFAAANISIHIAPDAVLQGLSRQTLKFLAKFPGGAAQEASVRAELAQIPGISLTAARAGTVEILREGLGKAKALAQVAAALGIDRGAVMALGDYENDIEMLRWAGLGVAMGNASDAVKNAARWVTGTNGACGVARAVEAYLNGQESI